MSDVECCEYYYRTGKIPPINLVNWVHVYNLLITRSMSPLNIVK